MKKKPGLAHLYNKTTTTKKFCLPRPLLHLFSSFQSTVQKNSVASRIQTWIFGVEGKDADHKTTTMVLLLIF